MTLGVVEAAQKVSLSRPHGRPQWFVGRILKTQEGRSVRGLKKTIRLTRMMGAIVKVDENRRREEKDQAVSSASLGLGAAEITGDRNQNRLLTKCWDSSVLTRRKIYRKCCILQVAWVPPPEVPILEINFKHQDKVLRHLINTTLWRGIPSFLWSRWSVK